MRFKIYIFSLILFGKCNQILINWINSTYQIWVRLFFVCQKSLKCTFRIVFLVQNHLLNMFFRVVNSQKLFWSQNLVWNVLLKLSGIQNWLNRSVICQMCVIFFSVKLKIDLFHISSSPKCYLSENIRVRICWY